MSQSDTRRCVAVAKNGGRCTARRWREYARCRAHQALADPALAEQIAAERKKGGHRAASIRQTPVARRRSTKAERIAGAGATVDAAAPADVLDTVWPLWRRVEGRPIGFRSRTGDTFAVLGCLWPGETPEAPVFKACERGCTTTCSLMAAQPAERQRAVDDEVAAQPITEGEKA
jgi:hypothetical protein